MTLNKGKKKKGIMEGVIHMLQSKKVNLYLHAKPAALCRNPRRPSQFTHRDVRWSQDYRIPRQKWM